MILQSIRSNLNIYHVVSILFCSIGISEGLKCHQCQNDQPVEHKRFCSTPKNHRIQSCKSDNDVCFTYLFVDIRNGVYGSQYGCYPRRNFTELETSLYTGTKAKCSVVELVNKESQTDGEVTMCFCEEDLCNRLGQQVKGQRLDSGQRSFHRPSLLHLVVFVFTAFNLYEYCLD